VLWTSFGELGVKADTAVARALPVQEDARLADWRKQRYIGRGRSRLQVPTCPAARHETGPLYASSLPSSLIRELLTPHFTSGTAYDLQVTRRQAVRTRSMNCAFPATPAVNMR
jgi:hypothetical protein